MVRSWLPVLLAVGCACGGWHVAAREALAETVWNHAERVIQLGRSGSRQRSPVMTAVAIAPEGDRVATAGDDHHVRIWSLNNGQMMADFRGHADWIRAASFSPDGRLLATAGDDRRVRLWDTASRTSHDRFSAHTAPIYALAFSADASLLAAADFDGMVRVYTLAGGGSVQTLVGPGKDLRAICFSDDGTQLAAAGRDGVIRIWEMPTAQMSLDIAAHPRRIRAATFSPDGSRILTAGDDGTLRVHSALDGTEQLALGNRRGSIRSLSFYGIETIAAGGTDNMIELWDLNTGSRIGRLEGHRGTVAVLDGQTSAGMLVSGSFDTTVRVWSPSDVATENTARNPSEAAAR